MTRDEGGESEKEVGDVCLSLRFAGNPVLPPVHLVPGTYGIGHLPARRQVFPRISELERSGTSTSRSNGSGVRNVLRWSLTLGVLTLLMNNPLWA